MSVPVTHKLVPRDCKFNHKASNSLHRKAGRIPATIIPNKRLKEYLRQQTWINMFPATELMKNQIRVRMERQKGIAADRQEANMSSLKSETFLDILGCTVTYQDLHSSC